MRYEIKKSSTSLSLSLFFSNYFIRLDKSYSITQIKNGKKKTRIIRRKDGSISESLST